MDATFSYYQTPLVFAVSQGRQFTSIERLFKPFQSMIWCLIALTFLLGLAMVIILKFVRMQIRHFVFGRKNRSPFFNMVGIYLGIPMPAEPSRNFARTMAMIWMLAAVVIKGSYQGSLFDHIQRQSFEAEYNTIEDMVKANFTFCMGPAGFSKFLNYEGVLKRLVINSIYIENN